MLEPFPSFQKQVRRQFHLLRQLDLLVCLGLPYLKFLKKEGRERGGKVGHAEFARMQRDALENYLVGLIRAVVISFFPFIYPAPDYWYLDVSLNGEQTGCLPGN